MKSRSVIWRVKLYVQPLLNSIICAINWQWRSVYTQYSKNTCGHLLLGTNHCSTHSKCAGLLIKCTYVQCTGAWTPPNILCVSWEVVDFAFIPDLEIVLNVNVMYVLYRFCDHFYYADWKWKWKSKCQKSMSMLYNVIYPRGSDFSMMSTCLGQSKCPGGNYNDIMICSF